MQKQVIFKTKGMQRDLSVSAFNSEYAYENKNVRVMPTDESTLLSLINERGNKKSSIDGVGDYVRGIPIGQSLVNDELVLFTCGDKNNIELNIEAEEQTVDNITFEETEINIDIDTVFEDRIYKLWFNNGELTGKRLFRGDLGFSYKHPIEAISFYENADIRKVYWVDSLNPVRVINIESAEDVLASWNSNSFDFVKNLNSNEKVIITKTDSGGNFPSGVIQYVMTYYNKYGSETNIFYTSPILYLSTNKGISPEETINCSFNLEIKNIDTSFEYINLYSIIRTSINGTPEVKKVLSVRIDNTEISIIDTGDLGESIDPTELLYIGGESIIAGTIAQKDNTLFLGNVKLKNETLSDEIITKIKESASLNFTYKTVTYNNIDDYFKYEGLLNNSASEITTFKYLETYKIGIQLQYNNGKYADVIWLDNITNNLPPYVDVSTKTIYLAQIECTIGVTIPNIRRGRLVMAIPKESDKSFICQGIISPTVFHLSSRINNSPFAMSSWVLRYTEGHYTSLLSSSSKLGELQYMKSEGESVFLKPTNNEGVTINKNIVYWSFSNTNGAASFFIEYYENDTLKDSAIFDGLWTYDDAVEWMKKYLDDYTLVPSLEEWGTHTSSNKGTINISSYEVSSTNYINDLLSTSKDCFYTDRSICTFHSPDIEDNYYKLNNREVKLRIIGVTNFTPQSANYDITTSTGTLNGGKGLVRRTLKSIKSDLLWADNYDGDIPYLFAVYLWQGSTSLNGDVNSDYNARTSLLKSKTISNVNVSTNTTYLDVPWEAYEENSDEKTGITNTTVFNSTDITSLKIDPPKNSNMNSMIYLGNVDMIINGNEYPIYGTTYDKNSESSSYTKPYSQVQSHDGTPANGNTATSFSIKYNSTPHAVFTFNNTKNGAQRILPAINNRQIFNIQGTTAWDPSPSAFVVLKYFMPEQSHPDDAVQGDKVYWVSEGIPSLGIPPKGYIEIKGENSWSSSSPAGKKYIYNNVIYLGDENGILHEVEDLISQDIISLPNYSQSNTSYIAELYVDTNPYEDTEENLKNYQWIPIGDLSEITNGVLIGNQGDTYYQRWDCLKTYPRGNTTDNPNNVIEIDSFMVESKINLDGRYDKYRGLYSNLGTNNTNFNLYNSVYSQPNNYFNYRILDSDILEFPNLITWSKTKSVGEEIDTWTNITLASTLDLDGDKGPVRAIKRFNNNLIAFQDRGISQVLYNENMQITSTEGVPIEIANSGKVNGKRYITDRVGCTNKWSMCETSNGIYFIDDITKGIFLFNGQLNNISDKFGFHSWINRASKNVSIWNPVDFDSFVTYYDKVNGDVFFISRDECLAFSEPLGQFTSFYSYEKMPYFSNLEDRGISFNVEGTGTLYRPWLHNEGDYNMYFGVYQPFYTTVIANPDMSKDKIFNNLEFRSDTWDKNGNLLNTTFDTLTTWNEYQEGISKLTNVLGRPSDLKKKFRIWRANIPRAKANGRDRMRNPWLYVKLSMEEENTNKTVLHDMIIYYFE